MRNKIGALISISAGVVFTLILVLKLDIAKIKDALLKTEFIYLPLIVLFTLFAYAIRAVRLKFILKELNPLSFRSSYVNIHTGNFYNHILPAKAGEIFRIYHLNNIGISKSASVGVLLAERSFDVISMIFLFVLNSFLFKKSFRLDVVKSTVFVALFIILLAILVLSYFRKELLIKTAGKFLFFLNTKAKNRIKNIIEKFSYGLHILKNPSYILICLGLSFGVILIFSVPVYLSGKSLISGYGYLESYYVLAYILFSFLLPSPPGNIGAFEYFFVLALTHLGYKSAESSFAAALIFHLSQYIAAVGLGFFIVPSFLFKKKKVTNA